MKKILYLCVIAITCLVIVSCSNENDWNIENKELYRIQVEGKIGFINEKGKLVIDPQFDDAHPFFSDSVCFAKIGERKGLINTRGEFVAELDSTIATINDIFKNSVATFTSYNIRQGIINKSGEIILPPIYKKITRDYNGDGFILNDTLGNFGYVNNQGDFILPCKYNDVHGFSEGLMGVALNHKYGYVDSTGTWVIEPTFEDARLFGDGLARVNLNGKWKFIDHSGKVIDKFNYDDILTGFSCNRAFVRNGNAIELIDKKGKKIANIDADSVFRFSEGVATFIKNGFRGKIDTIGSVTIPPKFDILSPTVNGLCNFEKNKKRGLVDTNGKIIIDAKHDYSQIFDNLSLIVCCDHINLGFYNYTYYDREGNVIWKDPQGVNYSWMEKSTKENFVDYFDSQLSELDPIEGIYYMSLNRVVYNMSNNHEYPLDSSSDFFAILRTPNTDEFNVFKIDKNKNGINFWQKKFVKIGDSNTYAIVDLEDISWGKGLTISINDSSKTSVWENGKLTIEDPFKFEVTLKGMVKNNIALYGQCEFIKDYPSIALYEQVQKVEWSGTGFAIADGYITTNYHVINGAKTIIIKGINGNMSDSFRGYVVASDKKHDIAIIKILDKHFDGFENIPYSLGKTMPEVGNEIFVLGYPMTQSMGNEVKLTDGIISATSGYKGDKSMFQISAAIQPGNSGGPLFDNEGNVIGIISAKHADAENANYAIKISYLLSLCKRADLGIKLAQNNKIKSKSLSKKVEQVKPFVYLLECSSH